MYQDVYHALARAFATPVPRCSTPLQAMTGGRSFDAMTEQERITVDAWVQQLATRVSTQVELDCMAAIWEAELVPTIEAAERLVLAYGDCQPDYAAAVVLVDWAERRQFDLVKVTRYPRWADMTGATANSLRSTRRQLRSWLSQQLTQGVRRVEPVLSERGLLFSVSSRHTGGT